MTPQQIFESLLKDTIKPIFIDNLYRTSGNCFNQDFEDFMKLFEIQKSRFNTVDSVSFTFNIGIYDKISSRLVNENTTIKNPKPHDCIIEKRVGSLIPREKDIWYRIDIDTNKQIIEKQIYQDITQYVLPYLESFNTAKDILNAYITDNDPYIKSKGTDLYIAIHLLNMNRIDEGTNILKELKKKWRYNSFWLSKVESILVKYKGRT